MASPAGVRLAYLRRFISDHGGEASFVGKTTADVCFEFVVPQTKPLGLSLVDHLANDPATMSYIAPANWYVSHAWSYLFLETVDSLENFFTDQGVSEDLAIIWFCVFNNNQHVAAAQSFEHWTLTFKTSLAAIGNVVMILHPWNDPIVLRRSWCVFEVYAAVTLGARFEVALARDHKAQFLKDIYKHNAFRGMLATIKSEASETTVASDRDGIFELIRAETSFIAVDRLLFSALSTWIKTTLEATIAASSSPLKQASLSQHLGCIFDDEQRYAEAERCHRRARDLYRQCLGNHEKETLWAQVRVAYAMGHMATPRTEWEPLLTATIAAQAALFGDDHEDVLASSFYHGDLLHKIREYASALAIVLRAFDMQRHKQGTALGHATHKEMGLIGAIYRHRHEPQRAVRWLTKVQAFREATYGSDHIDTIFTSDALVGAYLELGDASRALPLAATAYAAAARTLGDDNDTAIVCALNFASAALLSGHYDDARRGFVALQTRMQSAGAREILVWILELNLGLLWTIGRDWDVAQASYARALTMLTNRHSVWQAYGFALVAPRRLGDAMLSRVRSYVVEEADDDAPEAWTDCCRLCYKPIHGCTIACDLCPIGFHAFCTRCFQTRFARVATYCTHAKDSARTWTATRPPRRFFYETDLLPVYELEATFAAYETYCATYQVPGNERLARNAVPGLQHGWHPML